MKEMKNFFAGFFYAGRGIANALKGRNFRFMLCCAAAVIFFGARFYAFSAGEWAALLICCGLTLSLECVNTALETLSDKTSPERDPLIAKCKDCAAGAVLISSCFSAAVGVIIFRNPDRIALIAAYFSEPARLALLLMALIIMWCAVFLPKNKK